MAFWGMKLKSTKPYIYSPPGRIRISQATLGFGTGDERSVVRCHMVGKSPVLLCSLFPKKAESVHLELELDASEQVTFSVIGPRSVHLTGYYLTHSHRTNPDSESFGEDIGVTDSSDYNTDEDEYEDSFIDDDDLNVSPFSSPDEKAFKLKARKEKSDVAKPGYKRLKKYKTSDSEDNVINSAHDLSHDPHIESDKDQVPISSLRRVSNKWEDCRSFRKQRRTSDNYRLEERKAEIMKRKRMADKENSDSGEVRRKKAS